MRRRVLFVVPMLLIVVLATLTLLGCEGVMCGLPCDTDSDCTGDLVCYSGQCAPSKCESECSNVGVNMCLFDDVTCTYLGCSN